MLLLEIILLAIVQGVGEFLPISSSGHIVALATLFEQLGQAFDGEKLTINIVLHLGTLLAILVFYRQRIITLLTRERRVIGLVVVGTLPAVFVGLWIKKYFGDAFESALLAGVMFPITGLGLLWTARAKPGDVTCANLRYDEALFIGFAQAFAVLPGISRSGATIVAGLARGMRRDEAAAFSFLLAIPAIAGGGALHLLELFATDSPPSHISPSLLVLGAAISFLVGLGALAWLIRWLQQGRLHLFAWYLLILGPVVILWQLLS
jgi:undecaprenyl-diphosphatase